MNPVELNPENIEAEVQKAIQRIHEEGAVSGIDLEIISYAKYHYPTVLGKYEKKLMFILGLFFKASEAKDVLSLTYQAYANVINDEIGIGLSPVQASIKKLIKENDVFSFSAPTSAGKSHLFRDLILTVDGDIVFVVPSRSLLNEYYIRINEIVERNDDILVLQFIENINRDKTRRRIFVVTPERASELFKFPYGTFNIKLFLYDEAQLSEDSKRGIVFDAFVRRVSKKFPDSKIVFAHPFIENPIAQLEKHSFEKRGNARAYKHQTVGKIYIEKKGAKSYYFSPHVDNCHLILNKKVKIENPVKEIIFKGYPMLVYVSKSKIYKKDFLSEFSEYIPLFVDITHPRALKIIEQVEELLAAKGKHSLIVSLMRKGILVHHGSIPLQVRYLLEQFANAGFSKMCFSTSTLLQGVNMPFYAVWLNGARFSGDLEERELALKNLIGRAGRTTKTKDSFDYGIVIVNDAKGFSSKFNSSTTIKSNSLLDTVDDGGEANEIDEEFKDSLKKDQFDDLYDLPKNRVERLKSNESLATIRYILNQIFVGDRVITQTEYRKMTSSKRTKLKEAFKYIFEISLLRRLSLSEQKILSTSISILLWQIQGRSFKEILKIRYNYVTKYTERRDLKELLKKAEISVADYNKKINEVICISSPAPREIPDTSLDRGLSYSFKNLKFIDFDYDLLVYDTYDYLDKVIGYSLSKVYYAAFNSYYLQALDKRAFMTALFFKYGTSDDVDIWLLRYGFSFEEIEWIREHVDYVTEDKIFFLDSIGTLEQEKLNALKKFI